MMRLAQPKCPDFHTAVRLDPDVVAPLDRFAMPSPITVGQRVGWIVEGLDIDIRSLRVIIGVAPAEVRIVAGANIGRAEDRKARHVQALARVQVGLIALTAAEEADVRIDQQHGVTGGRAARRHGPHIGAFFCIMVPAIAGKAEVADSSGPQDPGKARWRSSACYRGSRWSAPVIGQDKPRLKARDQAWFDLGCVSR